MSISFDSCDINLIAAPVHRQKERNPKASGVCSTPSSLGTCGHRLPPPRGSPHSPLLPPQIPNSNANPLTDNILARPANLTKP
ncbi:hypothetical protein BJ508DRAFT_418699 [Ascobolus immersus RN42]|uniref:Uncharacterized protein n=1 Tax=Ascobolus immersus RN42 TaxID=1160509 RepID=A0A3N4HP39_ASCIM|nr:hypothetical protein BJ508DRAFT_418699 [Ascobolus immersus RN42]